MNFLQTGRIIAAVRDACKLEEAVRSNVSIIFYLDSNIMTLLSDVKKAHNAGKKLFIHIDLAEGVGKDKSGISFVKKLGVDGIISTRSNLIKAAKENGLFAVQRFFMVDSQSVAAACDAIRNLKADMIEIMPGTVTNVIKKLKNTVDLPIIAGGLIESKSDIKDAINAGAVAVSTGCINLWNI